MAGLNLTVLGALATFFAFRFEAHPAILLLSFALLAAGLVLTVVLVIAPLFRSKS